MFWRRLFKNKAQPALTADELLLLLNELKEKTATTAYRLTLAETIDPHMHMTGSKLGGLPYLDAQEPWPVNAENIPYRLLLQLRCESFRSCKLLPHRGLLQFFITSSQPHTTYADEVSQALVRWIPEPLQVPDTKAIQSKMPPEKDFANTWPLNASWLLEHTIFKSSAVLGDCQAERRFIDILNQRFPDDIHLESLYDLYSYKPELYELLFDETHRFFNHQLGGYPSFTGTDPRIYDSGCSSYYDTLLLQLDTDIRKGVKRMFWPDYGMAHFFINSDDLKQRDFTNILYSWVGEA